MNLGEYRYTMATQKRKNPKPKTKSGQLTIREFTDSKGYPVFRVEGYRVNGKRKIVDRSTKEAALRFIAEKQIEVLNSEKLHTVTTRLTPAQIAQAESAFTRLGKHSIDEAVSFYLGNAATPDTPTELKVAIREFLIAKEGEGLRPQSLRQLESTLSRFKTHAERKGAQNVHECLAAVVESFLKSLRAKNGVDKASAKTWNNYRADLSSFFSFCSDPRRRWIEMNPCSMVSKIKTDGNGDPDALTIWRAARLMRDVESTKDGALVPYFALALFAGIRPGSKGELAKLATHPDREKLIDLKKGIITIPANVSKTRQKRQIVIQPALRSWLEKYGTEILPTNHDRMVKAIRKKHALTHDVLRHTFISFHVAAFRSVGDAALEAGNSEGVVKAHYLNMATREQGNTFWRITPKGEKLAKKSGEQENETFLRAV